MYLTFEQKKPTASESIQFRCILTTTYLAKPIQFMIKMGREKMLAPSKKSPTKDWFVAGSGRADL